MSDASRDDVLLSRQVHVTSESESDSGCNSRLPIPAPSRIPFPWCNSEEEEDYAPHLNPRDKKVSNSEEGFFMDKSRTVSQSSLTCEGSTSGCQPEDECHFEIRGLQRKYILSSERSDIDKLSFKSRNKCHSDVQTAIATTSEYPPTRSPLFDQHDSIQSYEDQRYKFTESPISARIPSPSSASSITSGKRLEWDSGADVGYIYTHDDYENTNENLSTIERLALVRGCSAALFKRLDPEGISGPPKPVTNMQGSNISFNTPLANSTPFSREESILFTKVVMQTVSEVEQEETVLPGGCLYLQCDKEFENDVAPIQKSEDESNGDGENRVIADLSKKLSNSLINLRSDVEENFKPNPLFRSQSVLNLSDEKNKQMMVKKGEFDTLQQPQALATTCSVSSSSVATIVQKGTNPKTCDKIIQTLPLKLSVGIQVSENSDFHSLNMFERNSVPKRSIVEGNLHEKSNMSSAITSNSQEIHVIENQKKVAKHKIESFKCTGAHRKGSSDSGTCLSHRLENPNSASHVERNVMLQVLAQINKDKNNSRDGTSPFHLSDREVGTSESAASSNHTGCSYERHQSELEIKPNGLNSSVGVVDSANSFEYLPGEVFESSFQMTSQACGQSSGLNLENQSNKSPGNLTRDNKSQNVSKSSTLAEGIEEGVELLQKLISGKAFKGKMKKKLIQEIVNKLVNSDKSECDVHSSTETIQSFRSSVVSHTQSNRTGTNVLKQHAGSGDWADHGNKSVNRECSSRSTQSEHSNRFMGESALEMSEDAKTTSELNEVTSTKRSSNTSCTPSGSVSVPGDNEHSRGDSSELSSVTFSNNYRRNWKVPTSKTEKVFESHRVHERRKESVGSSDYTPPLLKLCKTEHVKQLEWIKFEINHLTHLKQLLEKQEGITKSLAKLTSQETHSQNSKRNNPKSSRKLKMNNEGPSNGVESSRSDISESSKNACSYESSSSNHHHSELSEVLPLTITQEASKTDDSKNKSPSHSLMQGSYILSETSGKFDKEVSVVDVRQCRRGQLNPVFQWSPKSKSKSRREPDDKVFKEAVTSCSQSYETALTCCCECKKALDAIAMRQKENPSLGHEHKHMFCKCHFVDINSKQNTVSSGDHLSPTALRSSEGIINIELDAKNDSSGERFGQKCGRSGGNVNRCDQESNSRNKFGNEQKKHCPCCGCFERDTYASDNQNVNLEDRNPTNVYSDAMVQADIKEPLAYLLTFQPSSVENRVNRSSLPEIKLLVPPNQNIKKQIPPKSSLTVNCSDSSKENHCPVKKSHNSEWCDQGSSYPKDKKKHKSTLQEYLKTNRPDYIEHADKRSQCLADLALLRDMRKQKRVELLKLTRQRESTEAKDSTPDERVIINGISATGKRTISSREMRDQARNKYRRSREVQNKIAERKKKEDFRTNKLMAELFTKNLQKRALKGIVNHSYSASLSSC